MSEVLLYIGSVVIILWGIAYLIPTKAIVNGFGPISADSRKIITILPYKICPAVKTVVAVLFFLGSI